MAGPRAGYCRVWKQASGTERAVKYRKTEQDSTRVITPRGGNQAFVGVGRVGPPSPGGTKGSGVGQGVTCFSLGILLPCVLPCPAPGDTRLTSQLLEAPCGTGLLPIVDFVLLLSVAGPSS